MGVESLPSKSESDTALSIEGLRFGYGSSPRNFELAVDRLTVERGARLAVRGPSGSGKSTLLQLIAGMLSPQSGTLEVFGTEFSATPETARRQFRLRTIGFVFQDYPLVESLSALDNVLLPLRLVPKTTVSQEDTERAVALLERLDIGPLALDKPRRLSQGERQRVAIARALIHEAPLLLADEPTTGLDPERAEALLDLLTALQEERSLTVIAASHDPALAERFDDQVSLDDLRPSTAC